MAKFDVPLCLRDRSLGLNSTLIKVLLGRYLVDVFQVNSELTLGKGDDPRESGWARFNQWKGLERRTEYSVQGEILPVVSSFRPH